jgi:hypothetical protein
MTEKQPKRPRDANQWSKRMLDIAASEAIRLRRLSLAVPSLSQSAAQAPTRDDPKEANMTQYAFVPALKALGLRIVNSVYNVSLAASIAFVFLVFIAAILAMAIWGRVIELPEFHRSISTP